MKIFVNSLSGHLRGVFENLGLKVHVKRVFFLNRTEQSIWCSVSSETVEDMNVVVEFLEDANYKYARAGFGIDYDNLYCWDFFAPIEEVAEALETFSDNLLSAYYLHSADRGTTSMEVILNQQLSDNWEIGVKMLCKHLESMGIKNQRC